MKFLQTLIENFSRVYKNLNEPVSNSRNFFTYPDGTCEPLALTSKPKNKIFVPNYFVLANFEILTSDLDTRPKIVS